MMENWVYGDFRTLRGAEVWATQDKHEFDPYDMVPANRHICEVVLDVFNGCVTFKDLNAYIDRQMLKADEKRWYQYDGRKRASILYEPVELDQRGFMKILYHLKDWRNDPMSNGFSQILEENGHLRAKIVKLGEAPDNKTHRLIENAITGILNCVDILKKC